MPRNSKKPGGPKAKGKGTKNPGAPIAADTTQNVSPPTATVSRKSGRVPKSSSKKAQEEGDIAAAEKNRQEKVKKARAVTEKKAGRAKRAEAIADPAPPPPLPSDHAASQAAPGKLEELRRQLAEEKRESRIL
jgi:hypothetical protein